jgi:hypothetical protein
MESVTVHVDKGKLQISEQNCKALLNILMYRSRRLRKIYNAKYMSSELLGRSDDWPTMVIYPLLALVNIYQDKCVLAKPICY